MNCLKCGNTLTTQTSERYPYTCTKCGVAYGSWVDAPHDENKAAAIRSTYNHLHRKGKSDGLDAMTSEERKKIKSILKDALNKIGA